MKAKNLIAVVMLGNLMGAVLTSFLALNFRPSWPIATFFCKCGWALLAFPLGWVGFIASRLSSSPQMASFLFGAGLLSNACLWAWVAARTIRAVQQQGTHKGFDTSTVSPRIEELRRSHALTAHSRSRHLHARKELLATASRVVRRFMYFSGIRTQHHEPTKETAKLEP